jgi:hypothetical protein
MRVSDILKRDAATPGIKTAVKLEACKDANVTTLSATRSVQCVPSYREVTAVCLLTASRKWTQEYRAELCHQILRQNSTKMQRKRTKS